MAIYHRHTHITGGIEIFSVVAAFIYQEATFLTRLLLVAPLPPATVLSAYQSLKFQIKYRTMGIRFFAAAQTKWIGTHDYQRHIYATLLLTFAIIVTTVTFPYIISVINPLLLLQETAKKSPPSRGSVTNYKNENESSSKTATAENENKSLQASLQSLGGRL